MYIIYIYIIIYDVCCVIYIFAHISGYIWTHPTHSNGILHEAGPPPQDCGCPIDVLQESLQGHVTAESQGTRSHHLIGTSITSPWPLMY